MICYLSQNTIVSQEIKIEENVLQERTLCQMNITLFTVYLHVIYVC